MSLDIILIGPQTAGKSTVGKLLADTLSLPQCSMDEKRWDYYKEIEYDETIAQQKLKDGGA